MVKGDIMRNKLMQDLKENKDFKNASIDEILRILIDDSDFLEVIACLDMIAIEKRSRVASFDSAGRTYPCGPQADLSIPAPDWKLTPDKIKNIMRQEKEGFENENLSKAIPEESNHTRECGCVVSPAGEMIEICDYHKEKMISFDDSTSERKE